MAFEKTLSLRASAHTGVAIPRFEGKCIDNCPTERENLAIFGGNRYLDPLNGGIATPVCALVRNDRKFVTRTFKHQFVELLRQPDKHILSRRDSLIVNCQL